MRNLAAPAGAAASSRRGSNAGLMSTLASPNQSRYKGLISTPGITKFSAWKRDCEIPKIPFHEFLLQKIDDKPGDRVWIKDVSNGRVETFGKVRKSVMAVASGLSKVGFVKGDVMCTYCPNYVEYWLLCLAAWSCGGCVMPINCEVEKADFERQVDVAKVKMIVCDSYNLGDVLDISAGNDTVKYVVLIGADSKENDKVIPVGDLLSDDGKTPPPSGSLRQSMKYDSDVIYLPFTSTSGDGGSVGICHTNKSLLSMFFSPDGAYNHWFDQALGESIACGNWFYHLTGLYAFTLSSLYGLSLYTLSDYSDSAFLDLIVDYKIATASLYTWQVRMLSQSPEVNRYDLSCLKILITGSSLLSSTIRVEVMDRIPTIRYVRESYGLNECGLVTLTYPRDTKKSSVQGAASGAPDIPDDHVMPVGLPNMYTQVKVINRLSGQPVKGPDEQGEICVKSPQNFVGYLNATPEMQQKFDSDGFFCTGDLGYYDSQGVVYFIESIANLIHFWMYEVAPSILESRLLGSNNILDAAVVAIPDKENGQVPRAFVVLRPGFEETEENITNLMESRLQDHERIRGGLYFIQAIPRDENWKVRRDLLVDYKPITTEELNQEFLDEESSATGANAAGQPVASVKDANSTTIEREQQQMALEVGNSPKLAKRGAVKELEKQPNGSFLASEATLQETLSPKPARSTRTSKGGATDSAMQAIPEDGKSGCPPGWRRSSVEGGGASSVPGRRAPPANLSKHLFGVSPSSTTGSRGSSRRGSLAETATSASPKKTFHYWMQMIWDPEMLQGVLMSHPSVDDCTVQEFNIEGVGSLPRAYVVMKSGYSASSDDLIQYVESRVDEASRLRAGIVFVDKLAKDPSGKLFISLDKFNKDAEGMDYGIIRGQPKVKSSQH